MTQTDTPDTMHTASIEPSLNDQIAATVAKLKANKKEGASLRQTLNELLAKRKEEAREGVQRAQKQLTLVMDQDASIREILDGENSNKEMITNTDISDSESASPTLCAANTETSQTAHDVTTGNRIARETSGHVKTSTLGQVEHARVAPQTQGEHSKRPVSSTKDIAPGSYSGDQLSTRRSSLQMAAAGTEGSSRSSTGAADRLVCNEEKSRPARKPPTKKQEDAIIKTNKSHHAPKEVPQVVLRSWRVGIPASQRDTWNILISSESHLPLTKRSERGQSRVGKGGKRSDEVDSTVIQLVTEETFCGHHGLGLVVFDAQHAKRSILPTIRVSKTRRYVELKAMLAKDMNISPHRVRIWVFSHRQNKTTRPNAAISDDDPLLTVNDIQRTMAPRSTNLQLFLHVLPEEKRVPHNSNVETILIFLKYFSVRKQKISGFASILVKRSSKVHTLSRYICQAMGWDADTPLKYFEEIKPGMIETMVPTATFEQSEIGNGDIICFQHMPTKKEALALRSQGLIPSAIEFYEFLHSRMMVHFKPRSENDSGECFDLLMSKDMDYAAISRAVGIHLMWDPLKLRFTTVQSNGEPKKVSRRSHGPLSELLSKSSTTHGKPTILYELRETSPTELTMEHHVMVRLYYGNGQDIIFSFWLPKEISYSKYWSWWRNEVE